MENFDEEGGASPAISLAQEAPGQESEEVLSGRSCVVSANPW